MLAEMNSLEIKKAFRKKGSIPPASRLIGRLVGAARVHGFTRVANSYRLAMVALVLILSGGFFTVNASASSQPGDLLYTLRLGLEQAGLTLSIPDPDPLLPVEPWQFAQTVWALEGIYDGNEDPGECILDSPSFAEPVFMSSAPDEIDCENKEGAEDAKEAAQQLKVEGQETAEAAREAAQKHKEEGQETADSAKEAAQEQKEEGQETAEAAREAAQEHKEAGQETAEAAREAAQDHKEEDREAREAEKEAERIDKQNQKDARKKSKQND